MENTNINIPVLTIGDVIAELSKMYLLAIKNHLDFKKLPTPYLWGAPGVGKSEGVRQIAEGLGYVTGKKAVVTDVRLLLYSPVDLRGIPTKDAQSQLAVWLKPKIFDMDESEDTINFLFLDELSAAPQSVQSAAYQICLDRKIGEHTLPDNCIVIAAGNRTTDKSVAYKMPKALCNRLMHFCIEPSYSSWKTWALKNGIDEHIIGYLAFDNSRLCVEPDSSDLAYPTPRSWAFASNILKNFQGDIKLSSTLIRSCVGVDTAMEFEQWCKVFNDLPSTESIIDGLCNSYPKTHDSLYALTSSLAVTLYREKKELTEEQIDNVCAYAAKFPPDFASMLFKDLNYDQELMLKLMKSNSFNHWLSRNRDFI
jgi:hypothetical protein